MSRSGHPPQLVLDFVRNTFRGYVLVDHDERRLTDWMVEHLHVTWCEHAAPRDVEQSSILTLSPPLNVEHASGPALDLVKAARRRYYASAGKRSSASGKVTPGSLGYESGPRRLTASHWCRRGQPGLHRDAALVSSGPAPVPRVLPGALVTDLVTAGPAVVPRPCQCHPVDLAQPDRADARGQPSKQPPLASPSSARGRLCGSPPGGRRDGTSRHPGDQPARRGHALALKV